MGRGGNKWGVGVSINEVQTPPNCTAYGAFGLLQPMRNKKIKSGLERPEPLGMERGVMSAKCGLCLPTEVKGLPSPCWSASNPSGLAGRGSLQPAEDRSGAARYSGQGAGGGSQRLVLHREMMLPPSFSIRVQRFLTSS